MRCTAEDDLIGMEFSLLASPVEVTQRIGATHAANFLTVAAAGLFGPLPVLPGGAREGARDGRADPSLRRVLGGTIAPSARVQSGKLRSGERAVPGQPLRRGRISSIRSWTPASASAGSSPPALKKSWTVTTASISSGR